MASNSSSAPSSPQHVQQLTIVWESHFDGNWHAYNAQDSAALEQAYNQQQPTHLLTIVGKSYNIDFASMKQINMQTKYQRNVRRRLVNPATLPVLLTCNGSSDAASQDFTAKFTAMNSSQLQHYCQHLCSWQDVSQQQFKQEYAAKKDDSCPICMCELVEEDDAQPVVAICNNQHLFHKDCLVMCLDKHHGFLKCAMCKAIYGIQFGNMPKGTMTIERLPAGNDQGLELEGYNNTGVIRISYAFPNGTQGSEHPHPGVKYEGTSREAYLPDDTVGNKVLKLLMISFQRRLTFTVGRSVTQNRDNLVIWNNIHHKTSLSGGSVSFGYPDPTYFDRVLSELAAKGVTEADLEQ